MLFSYSLGVWDRCFCFVLFYGSRPSREKKGSLTVPEGSIIIPLEQLVGIKCDMEAGRRFRQLLQTACFCPLSLPDISSLLFIFLILPHSSSPSQLVLSSCLEKSMPQDFLDTKKRNPQINGGQS